MQLHFLGGAHEVGASCLYLNTNGSRFLIDAGIRMGARDPLPDLTAIDRLDAVLITHAHMDHIGALPLIHQAFPDAPVYATAPTFHLMRVLLADAIKLMAFKAEQEMECPLYDAGLVARLFTRVVPVPVGNSVSLPGDSSVTFFPAGHILGAAMIGISSPEGNVLVTGDVHSLNQRTIGAMSLPPYHADLLVMESTYGNRLHANRELEETRLGREVAQTIAQGGKVLIPAFALGRSQEIILFMQALQKSGRIPRFPVYIDGLVRSVCQCYLNFPEYLNRPVRAVIENGGNPFYRPKGPVMMVNTTAQRDKILVGPPACIVSSSGMLAGGPSQYYAEKLVGDGRNAILFCGYQDEESPGRRLVEMAQRYDDKTVTLGEQTLKVSCKVAQYGLSAHADAGALCALVDKLKPRAVALVHGDADSRASLAKRLASGSWTVLLPENGECLPFSFGRSTLQTGPAENAVHRTGDAPNLQLIWEHIQKTGPRKLYTVEDIAAIWYGGAQLETGEQHGEISRLLQEDGVFFSPDWRHPYFYRAKGPEEVSLTKQRLALMSTLGADLPGKLVLLKDRTGHIRAVFCYEVSAEGMDVLISGQDGTQHGAEELLAIIAPWEPAIPMDPGREKTRLHKVAQQMRPVFKKLKPDLIWPVLKDKGPLPVDQLAENLSLNPADPIQRMALLWRLHLHGESFVAKKDQWFTLGDDSPDQEETINFTKLMEQNAALSLIRHTLPPEAGLYNQGVNREKGEIKLYFNFPQIAASRYASLLYELSSTTGWEISVHPEANQSALVSKVYAVLPSTWTVLKSPSVHREKRLLAVKCNRPEGTTTAEVETLFRESTGYELLINAQPDVSTHLVIPFGTEPMEINRAYAVIKEEMASAGTRVYKAGLKNKTIEVTFITPQVGRRHLETLNALSQKTGWPIIINEDPNQNEVKNLIKRLIPPEWGLAREPRFHQQAVEVRIKLEAPPTGDDPQWLELGARVRRETGYEVVLDRRGAST